VSPVSLGFFSRAGRVTLPPSDDEALSPLFPRSFSPSIFGGHKPFPSLLSSSVIVFIPIRGFPFPPGLEILSSTLATLLEGTLLPHFFRFFVFHKYFPQPLLPSWSREISSSGWEPAMPGFLTLG